MPLTIIHELNQHNEHRIVALADDGTNSAGDWVPIERIAHHLDLYAVADPSLGLPPGVFKVREVAHQVLA